MKLNLKERQALARILDYLFMDEEADFCAQDEPSDHIYRDLRALSDKLAQHNLNKAQKNRGSSR